MTLWYFSTQAANLVFKIVIFVYISLSFINYSFIKYFDKQCVDAPVCRYIIFSFTISIKRLFRTLDPDQVICACKYPKKSTRKEPDFKEKDDMKDGEGSEMETPEWRAEYNLGRRYQASYNIAPTDITPVIVSAAHFSDAEDQKCARVVTPMMWGMIPFWHKGDYRRHGLTTNNCRLEHLMDSKLYRGPFKRGQRCVVICEGFYEWQTAGPAKKPSEREAYLVFVPQAADVKIYDKNTWSPQDVKLLRMAGLFDVWEDESGDKMYSYSIITFQSSKIMSWMHYRMPAILETEQQMNVSKAFVNPSLIQVQFTHPRIF